MKKLILFRTCFNVSSLLILISSVFLSGCAVTGGSLISAAYEGDTAKVKSLLDEGGNVDERGGCGLWTAGGDFGATPLLCASLSGHLDTAKELIRRGADVNAKGNGAAGIGSTPLTAAAFARQTAIARLLIEKGADVEYAMDKIGSYDTAGFMFLKNLTYVQEQARQPQPIANKPAQVAVSTAGSDVDLLPGITTKSNKNAYAIVIGIEQYRQKLPRADFAMSDAKLVSEYLTKVMGYPEENVVTLTNEQAALGDFVKYFEKWLPNNAEQGSTIFVYYSGHGSPSHTSGDAYLVPYDGDPSFIEQTGYSLKRVYENLAKLPAKNIIVALDSCFSGAGGKSVSAKGSRALVRVEKVSAHNIAVLTASLDNQVSSSYEDKGHGVFTYFLLKGIKEMLGEDKNSKLALSELYNYIKPQVERTSRRLYNNEQTPQLITADEQMKSIGLRLR